MVTLKKYYFSYLKPGADPSYVAVFPVVAVATFLKMPVERSSAPESRVIEDINNRGHNYKADLPFYNVLGI